MFSLRCSCVLLEVGGAGFGFFRPLFVACSRFGSTVKEGCCVALIVDDLLESGIELEVLRGLEGGDIGGGGGILSLLGDASETGSFVLFGSIFLFGVLIVFSERTEGLLVEEGG